MEGTQNKNVLGIVFGFLFGLSVIALIYFYAAQYQPLTGQVEPLKERAAQLESEVNTLQEQLQDARQQAQTAETNEGFTEVGEIYFYSGYAYIPFKEKAKLKEIADRLKERPKDVVRVVGHSDTYPLGPKLADTFSSNWELSVERSKNIAKYLYEVERIDHAKIEIVGMSYSVPQAPNDTKEGRVQNRRVEILVRPER